MVLTLVTLVVGISSPAHRALAHRPVEGGMALGLSAAGTEGTVTGVLTLIADAGSVVRAFGVMLALSNFDCRETWTVKKSTQSPVFAKAYLAGTRGRHLQWCPEGTCIEPGGSRHNIGPKTSGIGCPPCRDQHTACCGTSGGQGIRCLNCTQSEQGQLDLKTRKKLLRNCTRWANNTKGLTNLITAHITLPLEALSTGAGHGSLWQRIIHLAVGILHAGLDLAAGIFTVSGEASQLAGTFPVFLAALWLGGNWRIGKPSIPCTLNS